MRLSPTGTRVPIFPPAFMDALEPDRLINRLSLGGLHFTIGVVMWLEGLDRLRSEARTDT